MQYLIATHTCLTRMLLFTIHLCLPYFICVWVQVRTAKHTCSCWLRAAAAVEASLIKSWSEVGRLWGLWLRGELLTGVCRRFDWFCGLSQDVVQQEQLRGMIRFATCTIISAAAAIPFSNNPTTACQAMAVALCCSAWILWQLEC
jgi:hypothetical protein